MAYGLYNNNINNENNSRITISKITVDSRTMAMQAYKKHRQIAMHSVEHINMHRMLHTLLIPIPSQLDIYILHFQLLSLLSLVTLLRTRSPLCALAAERVESLYEADGILYDESIHEPCGHGAARVHLAREREVRAPRLPAHRLHVVHAA